MDNEYLLAWANIEGWTTHKAARGFRAFTSPDGASWSDFRFAASEKSVSRSVNS